MNHSEKTRNLTRKTRKSEISSRYDNNNTLSSPKDYSTPRRNRYSLEYFEKDWLFDFEANSKQG